MTPFKPEVLQAMKACRSHAQDLFEGAKLLRDKSFPNIAYHLATVALEELGKAQLIGMKSFAKDDADSWYRKQFDDHIKKLFWAIWGDVFGKRPDAKELDQLRGTATIIHSNRLRGLYVETSPEPFVAPKDAITDDVLAPLMAFVEAKLALHPSLEGVEYKQDDLDLLSWFSGATDDPEQRKFIFSHNPSTRWHPSAPNNGSHGFARNSKGRPQKPPQPSRRRCRAALSRVKVDWWENGS